MTQAGSDLVLYQFAFSHYNEKARWTLDYKGLASERRAVLPGFHERTIRKLSGKTTTPVLTDGDRVVAGSAEIVAYLDERVPSPPLFPSDPEERREALAWVAWLDDEVGPAVRLALFHELLADPGFASRIFTTGRSGLKASLYRRIFPRLVPMLRSRMDIHDESAQRDREVVDRALTRVHEASRESGYLVGGRFTVADLTAGSLLFPLYFPEQMPFALPAGGSPALDSWLARWRDHPGGAWVKELWAKHR